MEKIQTSVNTEDYMEFVDSFYGEDKPADILDRKCQYLNEKLQVNSKAKFDQVVDPNGIHFSDEELQQQKDDFILYTFGVLSESEEDARKMAESGEIGALVGMEISPDIAAFIYRTNSQKREKWEAVSEKSDYTPSMGIDPVGGHQHSIGPR